jgi:hypothetical protein
MRFLGCFSGIIFWGRVEPAFYGHGRGKQVPRFARNDRQKGKSNDNGKSKGPGLKPFLWLGIFQGAEAPCSSGRTGKGNGKSNGKSKDKYGDPSLRSG